MKKKLRLQKEVVSVLDKKQMNYLTKGGALTQGHCNTAEAACLPNTKAIIAIIKRIIIIHRNRIPFQGFIIKQYDIPAFEICNLTLQTGRFHFLCRQHSR